jgi:DNA invertase Pin-like site-specific DNA recombinase
MQSMGFALDVVRRVPICYQQGVDTSTPSGRMLFQMLGTFAEFERALIKERVMAGLRRAKAQGKRLGRPQVGADVERRIRALRRKGMGKVSIARTVGCGTSTVQRILATLGSDAT